jgi:phage terminase large subunit-like protein
VAVIAVDPPETAIRPGLSGFEAFCALIDQPLEPYQRRIARAYFSRAREIAAILPRGNAKTTLAAAVGLHNLLTVRGASVVIGAASVQQARVCFERMEGFLSHPALEGRVTLRHLELRFRGEEGIRRLRVVPSDGPRAHGVSASLYIADELWAWAERADLLTAMQTGLIKRRDAKLLMITTSAGDLDSPLGRLRRRAMALSDVHRAGPVVEAKSKDLHWLEWSLGEQHELDNLRTVKRCNPAPWIGMVTSAARRSQSPRAPSASFAATGGASASPPGYPRAPGPHARARSSSPTASGSSSASTWARRGARPERAC